MGYKVIRSSDYLAHHGIQGQKWGVRRYQNEDGSLTEEGRKRYSVSGEVSQNGSSRKKLTPQQKRKIALAATTAAVLTVAGVAAYKNRDVLLEKIKSVDKEALKQKAEERSKQAIKKLSGKVIKAGDKAVDAALTAAGTVTIAEIASKFADKADSSYEEKLINKVIRDSSEAALKDFANAQSTTADSNKKSEQDKKPEQSTTPKDNKAEQEKTKQNVTATEDSDLTDVAKYWLDKGYDRASVANYLEGKGYETQKITQALIKLQSKSDFDDLSPLEKVRLSQKDTGQNTMKNFMDRELDSVVGKEKADKIRDALEDDPNDEQANKELKRAYEFRA